MARGKHDSYGPIDVGDASLRVIRFAADGGAPSALRRLAAVLEGDGSVLHHVGLGPAVDASTEQLVFVTLRPAAVDRAQAPADVTPTLPNREAELVEVG